ncbi:NitT/TauT family transport system ATP-binding protein [Albimonas donghaensis]|uniref:NitT/TauT family transport system ATP-binding protein n=1 Tax=Albimonas donghaensis TaxID=356660 RepID=A0A1H2R1M0_9RHOB|nr:ABC transporter ATP-binding protein [Albimonas donghaensis]SDW13287.1 NitT/TauT family transport system ATP-binding protein [Albimonas donghaensis]
MSDPEFHPADFMKPADFMGPADFIKVDGVDMTFSRGEEEVHALRGLDLSIPKGRFVAVVGPSGCGKSTLMRLLTGLAKPSAGTVTLEGAALRGPAKGVGMAFQNASLLPWRSTLSNVMLPFEIVAPHKRRLRANRAEYEARARALLKTVGLEAFADNQPWELSGGMQQRANVARAIVHEPRLMMLDEPFGALDAFTREELWSVMQALWMERGFTAVLITHDLREAVYLADEVLVMSARPGRIVHRQEIDLPRPRTLEMTYEPPFQAHVHSLRDHIQTVREAH